MQCLIGTKVEGLSTALTWLHENAHLTLPMVKDNIFALSGDASQELTSSLDGGSGGASASSSIVRTLVDQYRRALEQERKAMFFLLGLYGLVVLFAIIAIIWNECIAHHVRRRAKGGRGEKQPDFAFNNEKSGFEPSIKAKAGFLTAVGSSVAAIRARRQAQADAAVATEEEKVVSFRFPVRPFASRPTSSSKSTTRPTSHRGTDSTINLLSSASPPGGSPLRQSQPSSGPVLPAEPELSLPYLYGPAASAPSAVWPVPNRVSSRKSAHTFNPFVTPFDGPNGT